MVTTKSGLFLIQNMLGFRIYWDMIESLNTNFDLEIMTVKKMRGISVMSQKIMGTNFS